MPEADVDEKRLLKGQGRVTESRREEPEPSSPAISDSPAITLVLTVIAREASRSRSSLDSSEGN